MKRIFSSKLFLVIATAIIFTGIGVFADGILASDITYKNNKTVEQALNDLYDIKDHIETGSLNITFSKYNWQYQTIYFENEFDEVPDVYYTYDAGNSGGSVYIENITTTSFKIGYDTFFTAANSDTIHWIAFNK